MDKKGLVSVHAGMFFIVGLIIGAAIVYFIMSGGSIPFVSPKP